MPIWQPGIQRLTLRHNNCNKLVTQKRRSSAAAWRPGAWAATSSTWSPAARSICFLKSITLTLTPVGPSEPQVISRGMAHRRVGSHELNLESSRSHSIMTVHVESSPSDAQVGNLRTKFVQHVCIYPKSHTVTLHSNMEVHVESTSTPRCTLLERHKWVYRKRHVRYLLQDSDFGHTQQHG